LAPCCRRRRYGTTSPSSPGRAIPARASKARRRRSSAFEPCQEPARLRLLLSRESLRSQADLIDEGYDAKQVKALPSHPLDLTVESQARDTVNEGTVAGGDEGMNDANRMIKVTEHYIRTNCDGSGAKLWRVCTAGEPLEVLTAIL
jgi:hypothetical protein